MNTLNTPIYNSIKSYTDTNPVRFHMPGHKAGRGIPQEFLSDILKMDLTEIPGLDNLHFPCGPILEAQQLAATAFGADETFFLVNGSTCGIHAMLMTVCKRGEKLIVARDCHKSVVNGMILAGIKPVYIKPGFDDFFGISTHISAANIKETLQNHPDAVGVIITRPNYYGICSDIEKISEITHSFGKVLMVDEAHGAHLKFNNRLPKCAMEAGADICVQSAHKTLPSLTQGAYLHVKSKLIDIEKLKYNLNILQTTSPSYLIMAFLDIARAIMLENGGVLQEELLENIFRFEKAIREFSCYRMLSEVSIKGVELDRTRLVINVKGLGISGFETEKILKNKYDVQVEMSDISNIVCITTVADTSEQFDSLNNALAGIAQQFKDVPNITDIHIKDLGMPEQGIELNELGNHSVVEIDLKEACGKINLNVITPYPPGIPILCPGEIISEEIIEYIYSVVKSGGVVNGIRKEMKIYVV